MAIDPSGAFVLPQYRWDNSHSQRAMNFQREMFDKKQDAENLKEEAKNWSGEGIDKIDPVYRKPVMDALAKYSATATDYIKKNGTSKGLTSDPTYLKAKAEFQGVYQGMALPGTEANKKRKEMLLTHPDAVVVMDQETEDLIDKGDWDGFVAKNPTGIIRQDYNLRPNINEVEAQKDFYALNKPNKSIKSGGAFGNGKQKVIEYEQYTPEQIAGFATVLGNEKGWAMMYSPEQLVAKVKSWADSGSRQTERPIDAPDGSGTGVPSGWTKSEPSEKTITLSSDVKGYPYKDPITGRFYPNAEKEKTDKGYKYVVKSPDGKSNIDVRPNKIGIEVETKEYYSLPKVPAQTSSDFVIDGTSGFQIPVSGSRVYDLTGIAKIPYVIGKDGKAIVVSNKSDVDRSKIKYDYFAEAIEDTGLKEGIHQYKPYLIKMNPDILAAAEKAKVALPKDLRESLNRGQNTNLVPGQSRQKISYKIGNVSKTEDEILQTINPVTGKNFTQKEINEGIQKGWITK